MELFSNSDEGCVYMAVTNIKEFNDLINEAEEEACQLKKTVNRLKCFNLKIDFKVNDDQ